MIIWAIRRAGYELGEFDKKFPKVRDWLEEKKKPTYKQLEEFANKVHVPFGYLFLPQPPEEKISFPFFRAGKNPKSKPNINVFDTILLIQKRQDWLKEFLVENGHDPLPFVGKFSAGTPYQDIVKDIRDELGLEEEWAAKFGNWEEALNSLIENLEDSGVIFISNGVVENNTKRKIPVEECRGFVIVDDYAPFLFVNAGDAKAAQMFTIVHELAHIWLGKSAGFDFVQMLPANDPIEKLCNLVAAEFLVPEIAFSNAWKKNQDFKWLSKRFKVSEIVIARRALDLKKISRREFLKFYNFYMARFKNKKESTTPGGDYYATAKKRVSVTFASHVKQAINSDQLLYRDAYKLTGMSGNTFENFFDKHLPAT
jgi:Zn-dependent peptidase ImmA (M78 family)